MSWKKKLIGITTLSILTTTTIHALNKFIYFSATLDDLLNNSSGSFYEWKFGKIYYTKQGEGKPLLLLHDLNPSSSSYEWNKITKELSKTNTVYSLDLLGCGRSEKPNITYANFLYVQMITDFIKNVIGERCDIIATGLSGSFAITACHNNVDIIDRMILINPTDIKQLSRIPTKRTKTLAWLINTPIFGTLLYNIVMRKKRIESIFSKEYICDGQNLEKDMINTYYEAAHTSGSASKYLFASLAGCYTTANISHCLKSLTNSIFIICGKGCPQYTEYAEKYKMILPSIEIMELEDNKYLPQIENPKELLKQIHILLNEDIE